MGQKTKRFFYMKLYLFVQVAFYILIYCKDLVFTESEVSTSLSLQKKRLGFVLYHYFYMQHILILSLYLR